MASSKIRIRIGQVEIEYEGDHAYLNEDLPKLLSTLVQLRKQADEDDGDDADVGTGAGAGQQKASKTKAKITGSVSDIAAELKAKTGPDLIVAAALKFTFVDNKETFTREELLTAMQTAKAYYKKSFSKNLSKYLKGLLTAQTLTEPSTDTYALSAAEKEKRARQSR